MQAQTFALSALRCDAQQLTCWLEAVAASLRLAPCLAQLAQLGQEHEGEQAALLCSSLLDALTHDLPRQLRHLAQTPGPLGRGSAAAGQPADEAAALEQLSAQLWGLHTGLCRFVAALTSAAATLNLPGEQLSAEEWHMFQWNLSSIVMLIANLHRKRLLPSASDALQFVVGAPRQVQLSIVQLAALPVQLLA